jgi:hypothetical protein
MQPTTPADASGAKLYNYTKTDSVHILAHFLDWKFCEGNQQK